MRYLMTVSEDSKGYNSELHDERGELHYISRSFDDPEEARQAARDWGRRYKAEIYENPPGTEIPSLRIPFLTNRDPGDEDEAAS